MKKTKVEKKTRLSLDMAQWLENEAKRIGVSESALLAVALGDYRSQSEKGG